MRRFAAALLCTVAIVSALCWLRDTRSATLLRRGDFPAFYAAAVLAGDRSTSTLYSIEHQAAVEQRNWPSLEGRYHVFAYPPLVAVVLSPLARFSPETARFFALVFSLGALYGALLLAALLVSPNPEGGTVPKRPPPWCLFGFAILFPPLFVGVLGGQNTAVSLLCVAAVTASLYHERSFLGGALAALWLFKPQYGAIAAPLFLSTLPIRLWPRYAAGYASVGCVLFLVSTVLFGPHWLEEWIGALATLGSLNDFNTGNQRIIVSLPGFMRAVGEWSGLSVELVRIASFAVGGGVFLGAGWWLMQVSKRDPLGALLTIPAWVVLISPQTAFYDIGMAVIPLLFLIRVGNDRVIWALCGVWLGSALLQLLQRESPVPTMFAISVLVAGVSVHACNARAKAA